ncbi:hypothetical protein VTL71DRAFT_4784 [Oculimacula yallundae]|uniref:Erythromycin biosynthesis protein CIII-like C-terminal domain-containing protein n=1 Tax=Oculimacula yallundae TaxID=86028 RepID=A0ABR4C2X8_9HELO
MSSGRSVLFLTNCELGQSNVILAVAYELLKKGDLDVHIASWTALEPRVLRLSRQLFGPEAENETKRITFHSIPGLSMFDSAMKNFGQGRHTLQHKPGYAGTKHVREMTPQMLAAWTPEEHIRLVDWFKDLATTLKPTIVVLDPILSPAHDMIRGSNWKYAVLSPISLVSSLSLVEPWLAGFWKYPWQVMLCSNFATGFPYPLPWLNLLENIYCIFNAISMSLSHPHIKVLNATRRAHGIHGLLAAFEPYVKDVLHICPTLPEIDLPVKFPVNVHNVGPIVLPEQQLSESNPELLIWLQKGPTVLLNLGTHQEGNADQARGQAMGLRILLNARPDVQVLWKFRAAPKSDASEEIEALLGAEIRQGNVRVVNWLDSEPLSILQSGCIKVAVHHGGANSWFEATWAGVPQVVLAQWLDTYDNASLAEYLGIGVYGNKTTAPMIAAEEFGNALMRAMGDDTLREKAQAIGKLCQGSGGRRLAADLITQLAYE